MAVCLVDEVFGEFSCVRVRLLMFVIENTHTPVDSVVSPEAPSSPGPRSRSDAQTVSTTECCQMSSYWDPSTGRRHLQHTKHVTAQR